MSAFIRSPNTFRYNTIQILYLYCIKKQLVLYKKATVSALFRRAPEQAFDPQYFKQH